MDFLPVIAGDDFILDATLLEDDGTPVDLTGCTVFFTCKRDPNDTDDDALFKGQTASHTDPTQGQTRILIPKEQMVAVPQGQWYGDLQLRDASGMITTPSGVFTVGVKTGITQRIA